MTRHSRVTSDGTILQDLCDRLLQEFILQNCTILVKNQGLWEVVREATVRPHGVIQVSVTDGAVLLDDHVTSLMQKRMAGVLAWWSPEIRDVINGIQVIPFQEDSDREIAKAVRFVLDKDPFVNAERIHVTMEKAVVVLEGVVPSASEKEMAELDAWYVFGVEQVDNRLESRP